MIKITIKTDNAAFDDKNGGCYAEESARILRDIADKLEAGYKHGHANDINGNCVAMFEDDDE